MENRSTQSGQDIRIKALLERAVRSLQGDASGTHAPSQQRVLRTLALQGEMTQQLLLDELGLAPASLSEVVGKLEEQGLITRERLDQDKRIRVIRLTKKGREETSRLLGADEAKAIEALSRFTSEEKRQLEELLEKI